MKYLPLNVKHPTVNQSIKQSIKSVFFVDNLTHRHRSSKKEPPLDQHQTCLQSNNRSMKCTTILKIAQTKIETGRASQPVDIVENL